MGTALRPPDPEIALDTPSPALGKAAATAVHQALTDPYFAPLERLAAYLHENPKSDSISLELMVRWSIDDQFPTCFVWDVRTEHLEFSQPSSPWALEEVVSRLRQGMLRDNPRSLLMVDTFSVDGERYWSGFLKVPLSGYPLTMMAGVLVNMDDYLEEDAPRLIGKFTERRRFPLFELQRNDPPLHGEPDGDLAFRILDGKGNIYFQQGRDFNPEQMIYSESQYYPNPIVAMQEGWDLQVFSSKAVKPLAHSLMVRRTSWRLAGVLLLVGLFYWWGGTRGKAGKES